jgi:hypothetical protein
MADGMPDSGFRQVGVIPAGDGRPETVVLSKTGRGGMFDPIAAPRQRDDAEREGR